MTTTTNSVITSQQFLEHWKGHRALTRKIIEAFPEKDLFEFSVGGMRTFAELAMEVVSIAFYGVEGLTTGQWRHIEKLPYFTGEKNISTKQELLNFWDETTAYIEQEKEKLLNLDFSQHIKSFEMYENTICSSMLYWIDNEVHHRGQGYVYLRALGITPPFFWDRF
ncbi:DinB family protein [Flavobacterium beibuense]|uniref:DinB family protein n=1 Tax=Flavobacterium beibuense TaxID=657326 RepID=A0A444WD51_9FLAO|nr:DinB family protein [Flavobacterium beibuense]RYJ43729.1 DinB family protein [Flavobacterium beibuense]